MILSRAALVLFSLAVLTFGQENSTITPPAIPPPGENKLPPNTRVIEGVVLDSKGAPVPKAVVLLQDTKTLQIRSFITQQDGNYHFYGLNTDVNYQLRAHDDEMACSWKLVSVFNSRKHVKVKLKLDKKLERKKA